MQQALIEIAEGQSLAHLTDQDPTIRRLAVSGCVRLLGQSQVRAALAERAGHDPDERVRAEAIEALGGHAEGWSAVWQQRDDSSPIVREAVATALGELGRRQALAWLMATTQDHDLAVAEAAVAALGSLEDPRALPLLLTLAETARPQVRRRTLVALTAFDDPAARAALDKALTDRNPMVREAAVVGRGGSCC